MPVVAHPAAALAGDAELARRLEGAPPAEGLSGPVAAARLAWGLLLAQSGPETAQGGFEFGFRFGCGFGPDCFGWKLWVLRCSLAGCHGCWHLPASDTWPCSQQLNEFLNRCSAWPPSLQLGFVAIVHVSSRTLSPQPCQNHIISITPLLRCCIADRAAKAVRQATEAGALGWLDSGMLRSVAFADDDPPQRELYAATAHQLLMLLLDAAAGRCFQLLLPS